MADGKSADPPIWNVKRPSYIGSMSGKRSKSRKSAEILAGKPRCIYCAATAETVEHMPSKAMFRGKQRPSGLEFPCCKPCNNGTSAADSLVAFLARIDRFSDDVDGWQVNEALKYLVTAGSLAPGLINEFFDEGQYRETLMQTPGGFIMPVTQTNAGPIAQALLGVWGAKLAMALYHEHTGKPLPMDGGVHVNYFLNNGLDQATGDNFLRILPVYNTLKQGERKSASGQFDYRYNSDDKSIVAAMTHFHSNIHFFTIAMAEPVVYGFPKDKLPHGVFVRPGELLKFMPKPPPAILLRRQPSGLLLPQRPFGR